MPEGWVQRSEGNEASFFLAALFSPERGREKATRWRGGAAACGGKKATWGSDGGAAKLGGHASREKAEIHSLPLSLVAIQFLRVSTREDIWETWSLLPESWPQPGSFPVLDSNIFLHRHRHVPVGIKKKKEKKRTLIISPIA